jgi:hypothetical protein
MQVAYPFGFPEFERLCIILNESDLAIRNRKFLNPDQKSKYY